MNEARIIDGKAFAAGLRGRVGAEAARIEAEHGVEAGLAVVLVGENPASQVYVRNKSRQTGEAGMNSFQHTLPAETSQAELLDLVTRLNAQFLALIDRQRDLPFRTDFWHVCTSLRIHE